MLIIICILLKSLLGGETAVGVCRPQASDRNMVLVLIRGSATSGNIELGLDGDRVDAVLMENLLDFVRQSHELRRVGGDAHMQRGDKGVFLEDPDVQVVQLLDAVQGHNVVFDVLSINVLRHGLQQNGGGGSAQGKSRGEDDDRDDERNDGVGVVLPRVVRLPDEESSGNNTNVSKSISHNVEEDALHVERNVLLLLGLLLGVEVCSVLGGVNVGDGSSVRSGVLEKRGLLGGGSELRGKHSINSSLLVVVRVTVVVIVIMSVAVTSMAMLVEQQQTHNVGAQASGSDNGNELGVGDHLGLKQSLDGLEQNGQAQGQQENGVGQSSENLGSLPSVRVL